MGFQKETDTMPMVTVVVCTGSLLQGRLASLPLQDGSQTVRLTRLNDLGDSMYSRFML